MKVWLKLKVSIEETNIKNLCLCYIFNWVCIMKTDANRKKMVWFYSLEFLHLLYELSITFSDCI